MPRKPRFYLPGLPDHIVQRGNNRDPIFLGESNYAAYLGCLKRPLTKYHDRLHAYVLLTNHVQLPITPSAENPLSRLM